MIPWGSTQRVFSADGEPLSALAATRELERPAWSPDGQRIAGAGVFGYYEDAIVIANLAGMASTNLYSHALISHIGWGSNFAWLSDNRRVVSRGGDSTIVLWDTETGQPEWTTLLINGGKSITFSATGEIIDGDPDVIERELVYLVEDDQGAIDVLTPAEFPQRVKAVTAGQE